MNVGLELFDKNGILIYGKQDRMGVISGTVSYHPSLEMVKRAIASNKDDYGYRYADADITTIKNKYFQKGSILMPYQYSFGIIYLRDFVPYPSFSKNIKVTNLFNDEDYGLVRYAEVPTIEDLNTFGSGMGVYGGFGYVEEISVVMPKILESENGVLQLGYDVPLFLGNCPIRARKYSHLTKFVTGNVLCLVGIDAMVFNPGAKNEISRNQRRR